MILPIENLWIAEVTNENERYGTVLFALRADTEVEAYALLENLVAKIAQSEHGELTVSLWQERLTEQVTELR